ncbi:MAG: glycoside hydrolase TIM-barrel-like domain-containing protein, partial [Hyphomicrobiales bacterium]|nr:glycoside hydrolase TIM-barrel-like domain-containing protein [Hyphomicrobiales bacterium]
LMVSLPEGDRLAQTRSPYFINQQLLANKQLRWWWNNPHQAIYDDGDGTGWSPHGSPTEWAPQSKSICFLEYGFPACDKATNQPNVFFDPIERQRDPLLVDLAANIRRRPRSAARRHFGQPRAASRLRILERRRLQ